MWMPLQIISGRNRIQHDLSLFRDGRLAGITEIMKYVNGC